MLLFWCAKKSTYILAEVWTRGASVRRLGVNRVPWLPFNFPQHWRVPALIKLRCKRNNPNLGADSRTPHYYIFKNRPLFNEHVRAINVTIPKFSMGPIWGPDSGPKNGPHSMSTNSWWTPQENQILVHQADPILNRFRKKSLKFHKAQNRCIYSFRMLPIHRIRPKS